jgi:hypothetical protein
MTNEEILINLKKFRDYASESLAYNMLDDTIKTMEEMMEDDA